MATTADLTDLYRARLGAASDGLLARLNMLWRAGFNPADPMGSLSRISAAGATLVTGGQAVAANEASLYLRALTALAAGGGMWSTAPYAVPPGLVGSTAAGLPMNELLGISRSVYASAVQGGAESEQAASSASSWLSRVAASEPFRAANGTVTGNASTDDRLTGRVNRITRPGACEFCLLIADRGYLPAHAGFHAHAHCRCVASAEISSRVYSKSGKRRAQIAEREADADRQRVRDEIKRRADAAAAARAAEQAAQEQAAAYQMQGFEGYPEAEQGARDGIATALAPLSPANRAKFHGITRQPDSAYEAGAGKNLKQSWAYYMFGSGEVTLRAGVGYGRMIAEAEHAYSQGWWTPVSAKHTRVSGTVAHEVGHFVDDLMTPEQRADVLGEVDQAVNARASFHMGSMSRTEYADLWDIQLKAARKELTSEYATMSDREMIAELWAEYTCNPAPRPVAKAVGDKIVSFLGSGSSAWKRSYGVHFPT